MNHLFHRGIVVRSCDGLDVIVLIVTLRGFHLLENHTGSHSVCTRDIGVVEALYLEG